MSNVILSNRYLAESHFPNTSFSRKSFSRKCIEGLRRNDIFCFIQFWENDFRANDVSGKRRSAERRFVKTTFGWTKMQENDVRRYEVSLIRRFGHVTIRWNDFRQFFYFGKTTIRQNDDSTKRCFGKMMWPQKKLDHCSAREFCAHFVRISSSTQYHPMHEYAVPIDVNGGYNVTRDNATTM